jgi:hypothetical protein
MLRRVGDDRGIASATAATASVFGTDNKALQCSLEFRYRKALLGTIASA